MLAPATSSSEHDVYSSCAEGLHGHELGWAELQLTVKGQRSKKRAVGRTELLCVAGCSCSGQ